MKVGRTILFVTLFIFFLVFISVIFTLISKGTMDKVALVRVEGPIIEAKTVVEEIKGYVKDSSVRAIVLRVDSPGGSAVDAMRLANFLGARRTSPAKIKTVA